VIFRLRQASLVFSRRRRDESRLSGLLKSAQRWRMSRAHSRPHLMAINRDGLSVHNRSRSKRDLNPRLPINRSLRIESLFLSRTRVDRSIRETHSRLAVLLSAYVRFNRESRCVISAVVISRAPFAAWLSSSARASPHKSAGYQRTEARRRYGKAASVSRHFVEMSDRCDSPSSLPPPLYSLPSIVFPLQRSAPGSCR